MVSSWSCSPSVIIRVTDIFNLLLFQAFKGYVTRIAVPWWKVNEIQTKEYFLKLSFIYQQFWKLPFL